jgi:uncharacterized membrane protein YphA (DoxX/SURF4 family)
MELALLALTLRLVLGGLWLIAAVSKLRNLRLFIHNVDEFDLLPGPAAKALGAVLPFLELSLGIALLTGVAVRLAAIGTVALLLLFAVAMILVLQQGRRIRCNCFGEFGNALVSWTAVYRNVALAIVALPVAFVTPVYWSMQDYWSRSAIVQPGLAQVLPIFWILAGMLVAVQIGHTLYGALRVSKGRSPDEIMRI